MRADFQHRFGGPHDHGLLLLVALRWKVRVESPGPDSVAPGIPLDQVTLGEVLTAGLSAYRTSVISYPPIRRR